MRTLRKIGDVAQTNARTAAHLREGGRHSIFVQNRFKTNVWEQS